MLHRICALCAARAFECIERKVIKINIVHNLVSYSITYYN